MGYSSDDDNNFDLDSSDDDVDEEDSYDYFQSTPGYTQAVVVNNVENYSKDEVIHGLKRLSSKVGPVVQPILDSLINNEDKETCLRAIAQCLSDAKGTALHYAARHCAYVLIAALLDHGEDPNIRRDWNDDNLKRALPLNVALDSIAQQLSVSLPLDDGTVPSTFRLVCLMASIHRRFRLECVRSLALRTQELNDEILKYTMEGKVIELCALMILGYDTRVPDRASIKLDDSTKEEQVLQLIETFARIGDKLKAYVTLKSSPFGACVGGFIAEIGSMFKDAGLPVCIKQNVVYTHRYDPVAINNPITGFSSRAEDEHEEAAEALEVEMASERTNSSLTVQPIQALGSRKREV